MKLVRFFAVTLIAGTALSFGAHATTVDLDLHTVSVGSSGQNTSNPNMTYDYSASGVLPADTEIVFTYTSTAGSSSRLTSTGTFGSGKSLITASVTSTGHKKTSSVFPVLATANIDSNPVKGTITIENLTSSAEKFSAYFASLIKDCMSDPIKVSYLVSAVPLPPAFTLFILALAALGGVSAYKKRAAAKA